MGTLKMAGAGDKDLTVGNPNLDNSAGGSGKGPIEMAGDGDKDASQMMSETPKVNKGIFGDESGKSGKVDFAGNV